MLGPWLIRVGRVEGECVFAVSIVSIVSMVLALGNLDAQQRLHRLVRRDHQSAIEVDVNDLNPSNFDVVLTGQLMEGLHDADEHPGAGVDHSACDDVVFDPWVFPGAEIVPPLWLKEVLVVNGHAEEISPRGLSESCQP